MVIVMVIVIISRIKTLEYRYKNWKFPQTTIRTDGRKNYIVTQDIWAYSLRPHALGPHALRAFTGYYLMIDKRWRGWPDREIDRHMYRQRHRHISLTGSHQGPSDPSMGINSSWHWTPILVIVIVIVIISLVLKILNTNTTFSKGSRTTRQRGGRTCYTATQGIWHCGLRPHGVRAIMVYAFMITKTRHGQP